MLQTNDKLPWLILRLVPQMTRVRFYTLIDHFQSPACVLGASAQEIASLRGLDSDLARAVLEAPRTVAVDQELELMARHQVRLLVLDDEEYPENLRQSSFPPPILFVRGKLSASDRFSVAIVGSRRATQYGKAVAYQFAQQLARCGLAIVSGFARGIDSQAHAATLSAKGRTLAVLGNGHAVCYPAENRKLGEQIAESGVLVSEYPMQTPPDRYNFPERNHLIAALSLGTLVVEAAERSGALITANQALEENRFVFAVPGDINRENSRGTNALIQSGARLVQRSEDILSEMHELLRGYLKKRQTEVSNAEAAAGAGASAGAEPNAVLSEEENYILSLIRHEPQHFDVLLSRVDAEKFSVPRLSCVLLNLELKGCVRQLPGRLYTAVG